MRRSYILEAYAAGLATSLALFIFGYWTGYAVELVSYIGARGGAFVLACVVGLAVWLLYLAVALDTRRRQVSTQRLLIVALKDEIQTLKGGAQ